MTEIASCAPRQLISRSLTDNETGVAPRAGARIETSSRACSRPHSSCRPPCGEPGPKGPSESLIRAIVELKSRNPRFGCPRIARIISQTFGVDIDKNVVHRVLAKRYRPAPGGTGPSWLSFVGHTTDSLWSVDLWRCASIVLQSYWVLVVMDQFTRRLVGFGVHRGPVDAPSLCRMCNAAIHGRGAPRHLSTDHDPLFEAHRWTANLRLLEIDEIKTVPHVPLSHPFVERLIGTMRREFLDHVLFWNAGDLERKLADFQAYYNAARSHASLEGYTPLGFAGERTAARAEFNHVRWISHCRGMVQLPSGGLMTNSRPTGICGSSFTSTSSIISVRETTRDSTTSSCNDRHLRSARTPTCSGVSASAACSVSTIERPHEGWGH